jgi:hypothetical protein
LRTLAKNGQIDPDLVDVFIGDKIFLRYAEHYLHPEQIDEMYLSEIEPPGP